MRWLQRLAQRVSGRGGDGAPERLPSPDALVLAAQPASEAEAAFLRDLLAQAGIRSLVKNRDGMSVHAGAPGGWFAYEVYVRRGDLARAREVVGTSR